MIYQPVCPECGAEDMRLVKIFKESKPIDSVSEDGSVLRTKSVKSARNHLEDFILCGKCGHRFEPDTAEPDTQTVLRAMLTENTGRHMLDSGSAYGRHWEKNQGRDFENDPVFEIDAYRAEDWYVLISTYHALIRHVEYAPSVDKQFQAYLEDHPDDSYLRLMEMFATEERSGTGLYGEGSPMMVNTYNHESSLDQTLQYVYWEQSGEGFVALQIHGGCDVRGGYTRPRIFRTEGEYFLSMDRDIWAGCEHDHGWHSDDAGCHFYEGTGGIEDLHEYDILSLEEYRSMEPKERKYIEDVVVVDTENDEVYCPVCLGDSVIETEGKDPTYSELSFQPPEY